MRTAWRALTFDDRWLVIGYAATPLWAALFVLFPPSTLTDVLPRLQLLLVGILPLLGVPLAIAGVLRNSHLVLELPGAIARIAGPVSYFFIQGSLSIGNPDRVALAGLAILVVVLMAPRVHLLLMKLTERLRSTPKNTGESS